MKPTKTTTGIGGRHSLLILTLGLIISLLFVTVSVMVATTEVSRINEQIITLFSGGEQVTYHIGQFGRQLTRFQLLARELIGADKAQRAKVDHDILQTDSDLTEITSQLPPLLHPDEKGDWDTIYSQFELIRSEYLKVITLVNQNKQEVAHQLLDRSSVQSKSIFDSLADLSQRNRNTMNAILLETKARHSFIWTIETFTGMGLGIGILIVWLIVISIIHQQRRKLDQSVAELEVINHDLDSFTGRIAHEIKNLLAPIPFVIENLKLSLDKPEKISELIGKLENITKFAGSIVDGLLTFSQSGQAVNKKEAAFLADEVETAVEELRPMAEQIDATIDLTNVYNVQVACSPTLLHVVIRNILHNALKFIENRTMRVVKITSYSENKEWGVLVIADTGSGIPADAIPKIFEPFYRVPGTRVAGSGVGLSTVNRIVHSSGGRIDVESELEKGTKFIIHLPLAAYS